MILIASVSLAQAPGDWVSGAWIPDDAMRSEPAMMVRPGDGYRRHGSELDAMRSEPAMMVRQVDHAVEPPGVSSGGACGMDSVLDRLHEAESRIAGLQTELQEQRETQHWYERFSLRGYAQFRINESICEAPGSAPPHHVGDRSVGENQNFLIRRARLVLAGDVSDHMYVYLQPDFSAGDLQLLDCYADLYLDREKVYRFRLGQSKVPYGWENLQSSGARLPLDRSDGLNSPTRDLGLFFYWTPQPAQDFFREVRDLGLKGSGNYGVLGLGAYNGQGGSFPEQNDNLHVVGRLTLPLRVFGGQFVELGAQAYTGKYTVRSSPISPLGVGAPTRPAGTLETGNVAGLLDQRVAGTFVWYPQPLGFQAEWNVGRGPSLNDDQTEVIERSLHGGYAMTMLRLTDPWGGDVFPFARWAHYRGGYKSQLNAPYSHIDEWDLGCEWQLNPQMEFTAMLTITDRTNTTAINREDVASYRQFDGHLLRFQFQINY